MRRRRGIKNRIQTSNHVRKFFFPSPASIQILINSGIYTETFSTCSFRLVASFTLPVSASSSSSSADPNFAPSPPPKKKNRNRFRTCPKSRIIFKKKITHVLAKQFFKNLSYPALIRKAGKQLGSMKATIRFAKKDSVKLQQVRQMIRMHSNASCALRLPWNCKSNFMIHSVTLLYVL